LISHIYPATNALRSPVAFEVPPEELFRFFREMRQQGLQHMGIYHSHPSGDPHPSPRDIERAYYSDVAYFVVVTAPKGPAGCGAFYIRDGQVQEVDIEIVDSE
jgi:proteasome lid subunit RPN8/RPN11